MEGHELILVTANELLVTRHHDVVRIVQQVRKGAERQLIRRWHILRVDNYLVNVAVDVPYEACVSTPWPQPSAPREAGW